jgi:hypothetical protein
MPNYASIRVSLIGPTASIQRFKSLCIRVQRGADTKSFDFGGLLPMPEAVAATLTDKSQPAQACAMGVCGFSGWYDWSLENWGVKWNAGGYYEIRNEPTCLEFNFEAAWSHPEPVFHELARQFPDIEGEVFVAEPGMDWGAVAFLHAGSYQDHQVYLTAKLKYLACEWSGPAEFKIPRIHSVLDVMRYLDRRWVEIHAHLPPEWRTQLDLSVTIGAALDEADRSAAARLFQHVTSVRREVGTIGSMRFDETCFGTNLGRELMRIFG